MIKVEAKSLQEAYSKASEELCCSITDLTFEVVQHPKKGIFGLFKKSAIIVATCKNEQITKVQVSTQTTQEVVQKPKVEAKAELNEETEKPKEHTQHIDKPKAKDKNFRKDRKEKPKNREHKDKSTHDNRVEKKSEKKEDISVTPKVNIKEEQKDIFNNFYSEQKSTTDIIYEVKSDLDDMFKYSCFDIEAKNVEYYDDKTLLIEFDGPDSALLIGKEGYRYKALSYMIFNWINSKYQLMIRLEIAEFLKNQEEMIDSYLAPIIEKVRKDGNAKTKPLDGVLIHIALTKLRDEFPNKYVGVKSGHDGSKYIIINNFLSNNDR
jgi:spoIIIJ-associated protein